MRVILLMEYPEEQQLRVVLKPVVVRPLLCSMSPDLMDVDQHPRSTRNEYRETRF